LIAVSRYVLVLVLAVVLSVAPPHFTRAPAPNPPGCYREVGGIHVLCLYGEPYEIGLQQGSLLGDAVRQLVSDYLYQHIVCELGVPQSVLATYARVVDAWVPLDLRLEMRGIADGAGLSYQDVLLLNVIPDVLALTRRLPVLELSPSLLFAAARQPGLQQGIAYRTQSDQGLSCASYAVWGGCTSDGNLLLGHRLEGAWDRLLNRNLLITVRQPAHGSAFISAGLAGTVGVWAGMNEEQVTVALSSSPSVDVAAQGQPLPFILRQVMAGAGDSSQALQLLLSADRLCGGNVLLGDAKVPEATAVELSAHRHAIFEATELAKALVRTNHFLDSGLAVAQEGVLAAAERVGSVTRFGRLRELLESNASWIGTAKALEILKDDPCAPLGANETADASELGPQVAQLLLFDPQERGVWVVQGQSEAWLTLTDLLTVGECCAGP
jgi:hypothetical protein